ncbi:MAG: VaFE repeat-containing surface-anchored protein [Eubacterium sp.]|nr:VaFE repeat-containing surface-anchored protein [Eubacterium sp.]
MKKNYLQRIMALILAVFMIFGTGQYSTVRADENTGIIPTDENGNAVADAEEGDPVEYRDEEDFVVQTLQDDTTEEVVEQSTEQTTEQVKEQITEQPAEQVKEQTTEQPAEQVKEQQTEQITENTIENVTEKSAAESDTEEAAEEQVKTEEIPYILIVGTEDKSIFRKEDRILSEYKGIYLLGFLSEEERASGLIYYEAAADFAEYDDEMMSIADDAEEETTDDTDQSQDALTILNEILEEEDKSDNANENVVVIAVIDTGAPQSVTDKISVIGDDPDDDNGHGTNIIKEINSINPKAEIISIKAFDSKGKAKPSDIYAAIMYAVEKKVNIINLSASSYASEDSKVIREAVKAATDEGIIFVGAAGNNGKDVKHFIPGDIDEALIAGACDDKGVKRPASNFGEKVDYYVAADSTSYASARLTGRMSMGTGKTPDSYEDIFLPKDIKLTDNDTSNPGSEEMVVSYEPYDDVSVLMNKNRGSSWDKYFFKSTSVNDNPLIHLEKNLDIYNANSGYGNQVPQNSMYLQTSYYYGAPEDENFARVHPGYFVRDGGGGLNCTAFPVWVLQNMGVRADTISSTIGYGSLGSIYSLFRWTNWIRDRVLDGQMIMYNYASIDELLAGGRVKKGDLIIFEPTISGSYDSEGQRIDHHIGFYWGDSANDNLFWHSSSPEWYEKYGENLYKGAADHEGNKITGLQPKTKYSRVWLLPGSDFEYYMYFEKTCEGSTSMDGIEYTVTNIRTGNVLCTAVLDETGHLKGVKNITDDDHFRIEKKDINGRAYLKVTERLDDSRIQKWDITLNVSIEESYVPASLKLVRNYGKTEFKIKNDLSNAQRLSRSESGIFYDMRGKGLIEIYKVDESGNALEGAVFRVKQGDKTIADITTVSDELKQGYGLLAGLEPGKYTVQEISAPLGYLKDDTVYQVTIDTSRTFSYNGIYYGYVYDLAAYKNFNEDLRQMTAWTDTDYFKHFINHGMNEYRVGSYNMSGYAYRQNYQDLDKAYGDDYPRYYYHYINAGVNEMRMGMSKSYYSGLEAGKVHHNNSVSVLIKAGNKKNNVYVSMTKSAATTSCTKDNPNYSLEGTTYGLYRTAEDARNDTNSIHTFSIDSKGKTTAWPVPAKYMDINMSDGQYKTTTFYLQELTAGKGYRLSSKVIPIKVSQNNTKENPAVVNAEDSPMLNTVRLVINKYDIDGKAVPEGTGSLEGAEFLIRYYPVDVNVYYTEEQLNKMTAAAAWRIKTKYDEASKEYKAELDKDWLTGSGNSTFYYEDGGTTPVLPYGYLVIREIKAPKGYETAGVRYKYSDASYDKDDVVVIRINRVGSVTVEGRNVAGQIFAEERPIRGDIILSKKDMDGRPMRDVEFEITSITTGESYKVMTDKEGVIDSRKSGLWFGIKNDGSFTDKIDGIGALPCGEYTIREIRCKANEGKILESAYSFTVSESKVYRIKDSSIEGDDITNVDMPTIGTVASLQGTDSRFLPENETATVIDTISYTGLRADTSYTLSGRIAIIDDKGNVSFYEKDGEEYRVTKQFKTTAEYEKSKYEISGEETMSFEIDTKELKGCRIVVFEKLYLGDKVPEKDEDAIQYDDNPGIFPLIHEDKACKEQTLYVPSIRTTASFEDAKDEGKTLEIDVSEIDINTPVMIKDVVSYSGVMPGDYELRGVIMDKDTGKRYEVRGNNILAKKEFHASEENGETEILFELLLPKVNKDKELNLVVFEELYMVGNDKALLAEHKDINDTDQTIKVKIKRKPDKADEPIAEEGPGHDAEPVKPGEKPKSETPNVPEEPLVPDTPESPDNPVPATPPTTYVAPPDTPETPDRPPEPRTGDEMPIGIAAFAAALSTGGIVIVRKKRKKDKK